MAGSRRELWKNRKESPRESREASGGFAMFWYCHGFAMIQV